MAIVIETANSAEPSRDETIDWLTHKLSGFQSAVYKSQPTELGNVRFRETFNTVKILSFSAENSQLKYSTEEHCTGNFEQVQRCRISAPLNELSPRCPVVEIKSPVILLKLPVTCEPTVYGVRLSTPKESRIEVNCVFSKEMTSETQLKFTDYELAKRVSKAFEHLIKLSGGKDEPF